MIAVIDSGVGGLSVWIELRKSLKHNSLLYYADTANCPYGSLPKDRIVELTMAVARVVIANGAKVVVVACNTMTAAAIGRLRQHWPAIDFVGMEPAVKPAARSSKSGVVGILATQATLNGELYLHTRSQYASNIVIIETAGVGLVEFVERWEQNSSECEALLRHYIEPMLAAGADTLVLGCTHYPFLTDAIERVSQGRLRVINPAVAVARRAVEFVLKREGVALDNEVATYEFMSSGTTEELERLKLIAERL